jgi:23S rRNA pseudouridine2605 synthase
VRYGPIEARLDKVKESKDGTSAANAWITVTLTEGKNREVRKVLEALGLKVNRLIRLSYGPFQLGVLGAGQVEEIGPRVIREQLEGLVAPENMPKGDKVVPIHQPGLKPRRAPGQTAATADALVPPKPEPKPKRKAGWAKPKPKAAFKGKVKPGGKPKAQTIISKDSPTRPASSRRPQAQKASRPASGGGARPARSGPPRSR